jgi:[NiFe] hydrogenase diaphorase moiety large subunit
MSTIPTYQAQEPEAGLKAALAMDRPAIISAIAASGLKGRGGAGFPTSVKWNFAAAAQAGRKYVLCNADEGEPGTFKDRVILMEHADLVFEGMTIAGKAVGAAQGILFLRGEYAYLRGPLEEALARRRARGLLGPDILGSGLAFDVRIFMGAGAYICGEETALIECLEGFRGEPRNRPPFPVNTGYLGFPSVVNNVETLAWAACILANGADWFRAAGTEQSTGRKLFSVSGDCRRPGVYEFPLGITVAQLLAEVDGADAKAVQIGGAAGQCVPARDFGRTIAFEDIPTGGSVIVFGPGRDMLEVLRNFLEFFVDESCGQCTPCRLGNPKLLEGVELLQAGRCSMAYLEELCALGGTLQVASKCGLGQSSPNAFLSVVAHFREEIMGRGFSSGSGEVDHGQPIPR